VKKSLAVSFIIKPYYNIGNFISLTAFFKYLQEGALLTNGYYFRSVIHGLTEESSSALIIFSIISIQFIAY